mmetsp:Transcript_28714/g.47532  ORF Transcript_28714/g.47532 Transcript_28714/m.47532 type:complete len:256 (-) Transcript_28714:1038-1805(-)
MYACCVCVFRRTFLVLRHFRNYSSCVILVACSLWSNVVSCIIAIPEFAIILRIIRLQPRRELHIASSGNMILTRGGGLAAPTRSSNGQPNSQKSNHSGRRDATTLDITAVVVRGRMVFLVVVVVCSSSSRLWLDRCSATFHERIDKACTGNQFVIVAITFGPSNALVVYIEVYIVTHHGIGADHSTGRIKIETVHVFLLRVTVFHVMGRWNGKEHIVGVLRVHVGASQTIYLIWVLWIQFLVVGIVPSYLNQNSG